MLELTKRDLLLAAGGAALAPAAASIGRAEAKMIEPKTISENIMYSTARIVGLDQNGKEFKFGTGFFYRFPVDTDRSAWVLVTNKHVIEGTSWTGFVVHTISGDGSKPDGNKGFKAENQSVDSSPRRQH
jgi:hypothetical protein